MVGLTSTKMKIDNSGGSYEGAISMKDRANTLDPMDDSGTTKEVVKKSCRGKNCWNDCDKEMNPKRAMDFFVTVQEGIHIDIKQGKRAGETTPPEFWARVWDDIHKSDGGPPANLPNTTLRAKWKEMEQSGNSSGAIWEHMEREYPGPFLLAPLINRWHSIGQGKPTEHLRMFDGLDMYNRIMFEIQHKDLEELHNKFDTMKEEGKEDEFWKDHWDDIHGIHRMKALCEDNKGKYQQKHSTQEDWEKWLFPRRRTDSSGEEVKVIPKYQEHYPLGYSFYRRIRGPADERPIFKEFDFCS